MRKLRILEAAALEAAAATAWYEEQRAGLGLEFERAINHALDRLEQDLAPLTVVPGAAGRSGAKRLFLRHFPYAVVVRTYPTETIVVAFAHCARRPGYWLDRLEPRKPLA